MQAVALSEQLFSQATVILGAETVVSMSPSSARRAAYRGHEVEPGDPAECKAGDTQFPVASILLIAATGLPFEIPAGSVVVLPLLRGDGIAPRGATIRKTAAINDYAGAEVVYAWQDGDTDVPGVYDAQWELTLETGDKITFPAPDGFADPDIRGRFRRKEDYGWSVRSSPQQALSWK